MIPSASHQQALNELADGIVVKSSPLEAVWDFVRTVALRFCCVNAEQQARREAPPLVCYYSLGDDLVKRQLDFRRLRKSERDRSYNSLASLAVVSEEESPSNPEVLMKKVMSTPAMTNVLNDASAVRTSSSHERLRGLGGRRPCATRAR
jgi:hypothetical protein